MSAPLRLVPGRTFAGDYKVVKPLKAGGQGSLYVVEQISTSKQRALKLMHPELVAQETSRRRFELEARVTARIQSDHVVESIASGVDGPSGTPWLVMELLEGQDLAAYVQKHKHLPPAEVLEIFSQLCHALGEAHHQGIIHRDLKPENIFLANPKRRGVPFVVKVLDFGIARILAESQTVSSTTSSGVGTPMWMAPEQTQPGMPVGPGTDVWPLGLLAFRLLTGYLFWKSPYEKGSSVLMLMAEAFMHELPTATERAAEYKCAERLPPGFDAWFARCVARPIDKRFADAAEAFAALEPLLLAVGPAPALALTPAAPPTAPTATPPESPVTGPGRSTWAGAPEVADDAVKSSADSDLPPAPVAAIPAPSLPERLGDAALRDSMPAGGEPAMEAAAVTTGSTPEPASQAAGTTGDVPSPTSTGSSTADQAPPVQTTARPPSGLRPRSVVISAALAGVLLGGAVFLIQRRAPPSHPASGAVSAAVPPADPPPPPPKSDPAPPPEPTASAAASAPPAASSGEPAVGPRKAGRQCKPAGSKCLSHDECCDRMCRKWQCRRDAVTDPYADPK